MSRDLSIRVDVTAMCYGWKTGNGVLRVEVGTAKPIVSSISWIESVLNFFSNNHLTPYIDAKVAKEFGGSGESVELGACSTLGVEAHYPSHPELDAFIWDVP